MYDLIYILIKTLFFDGKVFIVRPLSLQKSPQIEDFIDSIITLYQRDKYERLFDYAKYLIM